jgi:hypothetical protein
MEYSKPYLIEPGAKYFIEGTLKQCREVKNKYITIIFNISMFILLCTLLACILIYRYKGKLTKEENEIINIKKQEYIISKLQQLNNSKINNNENKITNLAQWN